MTIPSVIPGDERLTEIDTHNCYICKVAQYLASHEALLCATYALVHIKGTVISQFYYVERETTIYYEINLHYISHKFHIFQFVHMTVTYVQFTSQRVP